MKETARSLKWDSYSEENNKLPTTQQTTIMRKIILLLLAAVCLPILAHRHTNPTVDNYHQKFRKGLKASYCLTIDNIHPETDNRIFPNYDLFAPLEIMPEASMQTRFASELAMALYKNQLKNRFTLEINDVTPYVIVATLEIAETPEYNQLGDDKGLDAVVGAMFDYFKQNKITVLLSPNMDTWTIMDGQRHWQKICEKIHEILLTSGKADKEKEKEMEETMKVLQMPQLGTTLTKIFLNVCCPGFTMWNNFYHIPFKKGTVTIGKPLDGTNRNNRYTTQTAKLNKDLSFSLERQQQQYEYIYTTVSDTMEVDTMVVDTAYIDTCEAAVSSADSAMTVEDYEKMKVEPQNPLENDTTEQQYDYQNDTTVTEDYKKITNKQVMKAGKDTLPLLYEASYTIELETTQPTMTAILKREE